MKQISSLNCTEEHCKFNRTCANHESAGDFRSEGGFTPEIIIENDKIFCRTTERDGQSQFNEILPKNHEELGRGSVTRDGKGNLMVYQGSYEYKPYVPYTLPEEKEKNKKELLVASDLLEKNGLFHAANALRNLEKSN